MISTQRATGSLFGEMRARTPSSRTSAAVPGVDPRPCSTQVLEDLVGRAARALAHVVDLHGRVGVEVELGSRFLGEREPAAVVGKLVVGVDAALHADLGCSEVDRFGDAALELVLGHLVGVGRAAALAEAAERAADDADVREVDVPVDDERRRVAGQLGAQRVGGDAHVLDHFGAALREERGQLGLGQGVVGERTLDRGGRQLRIDLALLPPTGSAARDEAPVLELHHVEHSLVHPLRLQVLRVDAEALGQRVALWREALPHLVRARERVLGRDVIAVCREAAEVRRASLDQLVPPVREVRRDLDADVRHEPTALSYKPLHIVDGDRRRPLRHGRLLARLRHAVRPAALARLVGDVGDLLAVVARVRNVVLEDHLLDVAVAVVRGGERLERGDSLLLGLADADEDAGGERDAELTGRIDRLHADGRVLRRRAGVDRLHQALGDRFEHQALRCRHLAKARQILARESAEVRVRQQSALQRPLASPRDVGHEVIVAVRAQSLRDLGVHLGPLARQDEELLRVPSQRLVEFCLDLVGRVEVRLARRERAVLAHAPARARERQRVVTRKCDPAHGPQARRPTATYFLL